MLAGLVLGKGEYDEQLRKSEYIVADEKRVYPQVNPGAFGFEYQLLAPFLFELFAVMKLVGPANVEGKNKKYIRMKNF